MWFIDAHNGMVEVLFQTHLAPRLPRPPQWWRCNCVPWSWLLPGRVSTWWAVPVWSIHSFILTLGVCRCGTLTVIKAFRPPLAYFVNNLVRSHPCSLGSAASKHWKFSSWLWFKDFLTLRFVWGPFLSPTKRSWLLVNLISVKAGLRQAKGAYLPAVP